MIYEVMVFSSSGYIIHILLYRYRCPGAQRQRLRGRYAFYSQKFKEMCCMSWPKLDNRLFFCVLSCAFPKQTLFGSKLNTCMLLMILHPWFKTADIIWTVRKVAVKPDCSSALCRNHSLERPETGYVSVSHFCFKSRATQRSLRHLVMDVDRCL